MKNGRFHKQLRDIFAPLVVRYVDLMESSIAQSVQKGFEKERWEPKGSGCATSEDLFWKLEALQAFIKDLHWPDEQFREHLDTRLKTMACEMLESCCTRVESAFQSSLKKSATFQSADFVIQLENCVMLNVLSDTKQHTQKLCVVSGRDAVSIHAFTQIGRQLVDS